MSVKPLCATPLTAVDKARLADRLDALCRFLSAPGDWGYGTVLGDFTTQALEVRAAVNRAETREEVHGEQAEVERAAQQRI